METSKIYLCLVVINLFILQCICGEDIAVPKKMRKNHREGRLIIKRYPAAGDFQSDVFEIQAKPYFYDLHSVTAVATMQGEGESAIKGELMFIQTYPPAGPTHILGNITGLPAGRHGLHITQFGDMREGCEKLGEHFNPYFLQHGGPADALRHVGDLGNVKAGEDGTAQVNKFDPLISLSGAPRGIVGRAIVVTTDPDDFGRGGTPESFINGDSGKPLACGVIAYSNSNINVPGFPPSMNTPEVPDAESTK